MKKLIKIYKTIVYSGIKDELSNYEKKSIVLVNNFSFFTASVAMLFLFPIAILSINTTIIPLVFCTVGVSLTMLTIFLNFKGKIFGAKIYFIFITMGVATGITLLRGRDSGSLLLFLPCATLAAIFFKTKKTAFVTYGLICLFFVFTVFYTERHSPIIYTKPEVLNYMYYIYAIVSSLLMFMLVYFFKVTTEFDQIVLTKKNENILDNIKYAKLIQDATLSLDSSASNLKQNYFVYYKPKDYVSGDFYNIKLLDDKLTIVIGDSTGHGVSGALMSIIGLNSVRQLYQNESTMQPNELLRKMNSNIIEMLNQAETQNDDRMELGVSEIDFNLGKVKFAGAHLDMYVCNNKEIVKVKGKRETIGGYNNLYKNTAFETTEHKIEKGDMLYFSTDGYLDQFGGVEDKKFKQLNFISLIKNISDMSISNQHLMIENAFNVWKGKTEQLDDVLVIGVRC